MAQPSRRAAVLALFVAVLAQMAPTAPAVALARVQGIDVSKWQGTIDWPTVAADGIGFVIIRATKGTSYVDPRYHANLTGATANGVVVGAYHRATPGAAPGDAVKEAGHFLQAAQHDAGDVIPALDIEETGGLSIPALQEWVRTWLARVRDRTGVRPLIYTSPHFWRTNLGDTTWFADHGYPLWIANWDVPYPQQIAENWSGESWTYWQRTVGDPGSVAGISTAIDRDVFHGSDLLDGTIAELDVTPATGGTITGPRIACGGLATKCHRLTNPNEVVTLTATPDEDASFLGWTGACASAGTAPTCEVTVRGAVAVSAQFQPAVVLSEDAEGTSFGWGERVDARAIGGAYRADHRAGASLTFAFDGPKVWLLTVRGPSMGRYRVAIDGHVVAVVDGWFRSFAPDARVFAHLGGGPHAIRVTALGTKRDRSLGTRVGVDALRWAGVTHDDPDPVVGTWGPWGNVALSDGSARLSDVPGATAGFTFDGTGFTWITATGRGMGRAEVWIDGVLVDGVGLYSATPAFGVHETYLGLTDEPHDVRIVILDRKNVASTGYAVPVDGWIVH